MHASRILLCGLLLAACADATGAKDAESARGGALDTASAADADGDGYTADEDCDDDDPAVFPGANERCNGADDDCDDDIDEGLELQPFWPDADGDGFGDAFGDPTEDCAPPPGTVDNAGDCDDGDADVFPGADEVCNGADDDCDDDIDEGLTGTWYADTDGDGYGDPDVYSSDCDPGPGWSEDNTDCDDTNADRWPDAPSDICDAIDNDCDGDIDEDVKAGWILLSVDSNARTVVQIDPATGATSVLSSISGSFTGSLNSMDVRANDGLSIVHASTGWVHTLDACDGQLDTVGPTGVGDMGGISFAGTGALYGISQASDELMQLDPFTGAAMVVGALGFDLNATGIAYDCATDTLYGADTGGMMFEVDPITGLLFNFKATGVPFRGVGLEFDPSSRQLLAATGSGNTLYSIDPATGTSTRIGELDTLNANDLAFHPPCR